MAIGAEPSLMEQDQDLTVAGNSRVALEQELLQLAALLYSKGAITRAAYEKLAEVRVVDSDRTGAQNLV